MKEVEKLLELFKEIDVQQERLNAFVTITKEHALNEIQNADDATVEQINQLEQRVTRLERQYMNTNNNKYNDSNYYMV